MKKTVLEPLYDHIVLKKVNPNNLTKGGLYKPDTANNIQTFEVVAVGPGTWRDGGVFVETTVKPGDEVIIGGSAPFYLDDQEYHAISESQIVCVLRKAKES